MANGKASTDLVYKEIIALKDGMAARERESSLRWEAVANTMGSIDATLKAQEKRIDDNCGEIKTLRNRSNVWDVINSAGIVIAGFFGGQR